MSTCALSPIEKSQNSVRIWPFRISISKLRNFILRNNNMQYQKTIKLTKNFYINTNLKKISMKTIFTTNLGWKSINFSNRISKIISISQKLIGKTDNFGLKIGLFLISLEISVFSIFSFFLRCKISFFYKSLISGTLNAHFLFFVISIYAPTFSVFLLILAELIFLVIFDNAWVDLIFIFCSWGW